MMLAFMRRLIRRRRETLETASGAWTFASFSQAALLALSNVQEGRSGWRRMEPVAACEQGRVLMRSQLAGM